MNPIPAPHRIDRLIDRVCDALARVHAWLGRALLGALGQGWRMQMRVPTTPKMCAAFLLLALMAGGLCALVPRAYFAYAQWGPELLRLLERNGGMAAAARAQLLAGAACGVCAVAGCAAWVRRPFALWILKGAWAFFAVAFTNVFAWTLSAPASLNATDFRMFDAGARNALWAAAFAWAGALLVIPLAVLLLLLLAETRRHYAPRGRVREDVLPGDRFVASVKSGGADPRFRSSAYWAAGLFFAATILPFLVRGCGREEPYGLVQGDGAPTIEVVVMKRIKEPEKKKKLIVNAWSPYIFDRMKIDDTDVMKELLQDTLDTYAIEAAPSGEKAAKSGKTAGWPKGMAGATVRFIRLKYGGGDWDQDMGRGADHNLLVQFHRATGFPIARDTEAIEISRLGRFPKKQAPPFVFLTGRGNISVSDAEVKALRRYLEDEGGMLFIDHGGGHFDRSVRALLARVLPGKPLADIANDDPLFRAPYLFPNGAPPFWHHAGTRALGVKHNGRWIVFYHPGDINDAWKDGHSGASADVAAHAYRLGINIMFYAFNNYYRIHYGADAD